MLTFKEKFIAKRLREDLGPGTEMFTDEDLLKLQKGTLCYASADLEFACLDLRNAVKDAFGIPRD